MNTVCEVKGTERQQLLLIGLASSLPVLVQTEQTVSCCSCVCVCVCLYCGVWCWYVRADDRLCMCLCMYCQNAVFCSTTHPPSPPHTHTLPLTTLPKLVHPN